jgi:hypothetical protein
MFRFAQHDIRGPRVHAHESQKACASKGGNREVFPQAWIVTFLRLWLMTKKQYSTRKVAGGTVKKSIAAIASRWFFRKINQSLNLL